MNQNRLQVLVLLLVGCGSSHRDQPDVARPVVDGSEDVADSGSPIAQDAATIVDSFDIPVDVATMPLDADFSVDANADLSTRNNCTVEQRYPKSPCPAGWFQFSETRCYLCNPPDPLCSPRGYFCEEWGDNLCYRQCKTDADCPDPCTPFCRELRLFAGGDHCGMPKMVCVHSDHNFCPDIPSERTY
jgi:hypothetical protein